MENLFIITFFLFGLVFGSFFNVIGLRLPKNEPFIKNRSCCPSCGKQLVWRELIPIISFLLQGRKCSHCKNRISFLYPVVELLTGLLFVFSYSMINLQLELVTSLLLISMLMIIFVSDITYMIIPNNVLLFFLPLFIVMRISHPLDPWWSSMTGAVTGYGIIFAIILISRGGMGAGDMKLFGVLGIVLGTKQILLVFFLACILGAAVSLLLMLFNKMKRNKPVPFGPYIMFAALISYFYGYPMINWYVSFLHAHTCINNILAYFS